MRSKFLALMAKNERVEEKRALPTHCICLRHHFYKGEAYIQFQLSFCRPCFRQIVLDF
jgi:hypothetical protein